MLRAAMLTVALAVAACGSKPPPEKPKPVEKAPDPLADFDDRFLGTWQVDLEESTLTYVVTRKGGAIAITATDDKDGEKFEVTGVTWTKPTLEATFRMPSTNFTTHSKITVVDQDTLEDNYGGDESGTDTWKRVKN